MLRLVIFVSAVGLCSSAPRDHHPLSHEFINAINAKNSTWTVCQSKLIIATDYRCESLFWLSHVLEHQLPKVVNYLCSLIQPKCPMFGGLSENEHVPSLEILSCFVQFYRQIKQFTS